MKNTHKILLIFFVSLCCYQAKAQSFTVKAGFNLENVLDKDDNHTYSNDYSMKPGFHIGATVGLPINEVFSFEPGLIFSSKGCKYKEKVEGVEVEAKSNLYYLDVPLSLKALSNDLGGFKVFGLAGPYVGFGLSGKNKASGDASGVSVSATEDIEWGNDEIKDDLKRFEMGLSFGGGVEINSITVGISYDLGLSNISAYQDYGTTTKNRVLKLSVGYRFGK